MAVLKNIVVTATGDVGPGGRDSYTQLKKWVEANGGRWAPRVGKGVTHLICDKAAWKKEVDAVIQAQKFGSFIVSYDWLEDSLQRRRKLAERKYTWEVLSKERKLRKKIKRCGREADTAKFLKGCEKARQDTDSGTSSRMSSCGGRGSFFASALDELKKRREERDAEEKARREGKVVSRAAAAESHFATSSVMEVKHDDSRLSITPGSSSVTPQPSFASAPPFKPTASSGLPTLPASARDPPAASAQEHAKTNRLKDLYHVYTDATGFTYNVLLLRQNRFLNTFAKYELRLYESHTKPHAYCTFVRYTPPAFTSSSSSGIPIVPGQATATATNNDVTEAPSDETKAAPEHPEAVRLRALITPPGPSAHNPYKALLTPPGSSFAPSFFAFRHAFRDVTLLAWEERLDDPDTLPLQTQRAVAAGLEPFVWRARPATGLPVGLFPAVSVSDEARDSAGEGARYVRNRWNLPGVDEPLEGSQGVIASLLLRRAEEARMREEEEMAARRRAEKAAKGGCGLGRGLGVAGSAAGTAKIKSRTDWNRPLFNGVNGRPPNAVSRGGASASPGPSKGRNGSAVFMDARDCRGMGMRRGA